MASTTASAEPRQRWKRRSMNLLSIFKLTDKKATCRTGFQEKIHIRVVSTKDFARVLLRVMLQEDNVDNNPHERAELSRPGHRPVFTCARTHGQKPESIDDRYVADESNPVSGSQRNKCLQVAALPIIARSHFKLKHVVSITTQASSCV
jgi:hypothetical protein